MTITQQHLSGHQILSQEYTPLSHHLHHNGLVSHSSYGHPHHHGIHHPQLLQQHPQALLTNSLHAQSQMHQSIHAPFLRQVSQATPLSKTPVISSIAPQVPSSVVAIAPPISNSSVSVSPLTVASSSGSHSLSASPLSPVTSLENISYTPSKVIHFRNVLSEITSNDLLNLCAPFGKVTHVLLLKNNQALVQFADINCAVQFIQYYGSAASQKHLEKEKEELLLKTGDSNGTTTGDLAKLKQLGPIPTQFVGKNQAQIKGVNVYPNFSSHQELSKGSLHSTVVTVSNSSVAVPDLTNSFQENEKKNRIILVTIYNSQFAVINVDVLQQVFSYYGLIEKIVMFNKTAGLQALIQYKQTQDAAQAKAQLNGQYLSWPDGNSCNLSIQFSNLQDLTVHQNSDRARDFTKPNLPTENNPMPSLFSQGPYSQWYPTNTNNQASMQLRDSEKAVLLVSNFNEKQLDCDKIFNLFSCYGYVVRIKIFRSKADHALVQMANHFQANTAIACLKGLEIFGKKLSVNFSKHTHINANDSNDQLTKDYSKTMLNRFPKNMTTPQGSTSPQNGTSSGAAAGDKKNRFMCQPTNTLHIFNIDNDVSDKDLTDLFAECGEIEGIRRFIHNNKHMALIKFKTIQAAVIALCTFHNFQFKTLPLKISFSTNKL